MINKDREAITSQVQCSNNNGNHTICQLNQDTTST